MNINKDQYIDFVKNLIDKFALNVSMGDVRQYVMEAPHISKLMLSANFSNESLGVSSSFASGYFFITILENKDRPGLVGGVEIWNGRGEEIDHLPVVGSLVMDQR